jgi:hypothetical protein
MEAALVIALSLCAERLEAASAERPASEDREDLIEADKRAVDIARSLIEQYRQEHPKWNS